MGACQYFLDPLIDHLEGLNAEEGAEYRKSYGTGGRASYYRNLQLAIRDKRPDFAAPASTSSSRRGQGVHQRGSRDRRRNRGLHARRHQEDAL